MPGIQNRKIHEENIAVHQSWERCDDLKPPKRNSYLNVPIPRKTAKYLHDLTSLSPFQELDDFLFLGKDRSSSIRNEEVRQTLYDLHSETLRSLEQAGEGAGSGNRLCLHE